MLLVFPFLISNFSSQVFFFVNFELLTGANLVQLTWPTKVNFFHWLARLLVRRYECIDENALKQLKTI